LRGARLGCSSTRASRDELLEHLTWQASLRPKDHTLLFEEIVRSIGGPDTFPIRSAPSIARRCASGPRAGRATAIATARTALLDTRAESENEGESLIPDSISAKVTGEGFTIDRNLPTDDRRQSRQSRIHPP